MGMPVHHFKLEYPPGTMAHPHSMRNCVVTMDGEKLQGVRGAKVEARYDEPTLVTIEFVATTEIVYADEEG